MTQAYEIVGPQVANMTGYASDAYDISVVFLEDLLGFVAENQVNNITESIDDIAIDIPDLSLPATPISPDIDINLPNLPADFQPGDVSSIDLNAIGVLPDFTATDPSINLPATPTPFSGEIAGSAPTLKEDFNYPDAPITVLPDVPTFELLEIPNAPDLSIPDFSESLPTATSVVPPANNFYWGDEDSFSDECLTAVQAKLCDWIQNGGTGLLPHIEQAIYDRGRNREDINSVRVEQQVLTEQVARGFSRPQGSTYAALDFSTQESQNKIADLSREIMIKQAEMEQQNIQFAIQQTIALETALISEHQQIQARSFEAAKYVQELAIQIYNANIAKVTIELEAYKAYATAYEAQVRAALSTIEIFKSEIQAQALISEINQNEVKLYLAQIEGVQSSVDIYKTEVDAITAQISAENLKIQNYKGLVEAFSAEVEAKKAEYQGYSEAIKGELGKVDIFDSQVKAFVGRVDAYGKSVDAQAKVVESDIGVEDLRLKSYLGKLDAVIKQVQAESSVYGAQVDIYRGQAAMYQAEVGANISLNELEIKEAETKVRLAAAQADVSLKNAEINLKNAESVDALRLEAIKSGGDISKGLAQASLSALNIGASVSSSGQSSDSYNENHNYQEK